MDADCAAGLVYCGDAVGLDNAAVDNASSGNADLGVAVYVAGGANAAAADNAVYSFSESAFLYAKYGFSFRLYKRS